MLIFSYLWFPLIVVINELFSVMGMYDSELTITNNLPNAILMTEDSLQHTSDGESSEIEVDV